MRKTNKLLVLFTVILALGILMPACNSGVDKKDAAGAIGKVKKYHKDQMKESDIKLRSEIIEDTAALASTLKGMLLMYVYYDSYLTGLKENAEALRNLPANEGDQLGAQELDNYCEFVENGNEQLCEVCQMCSDIYNDTVTEYSFDVEQNLRNYVIYLDKLDSRDSLVMESIDMSDAWISSNENDPEKKEQVKQVKKIRDEVLLRDVCNAVVTNNTEKIDSYNSKTIYNATEALKSVANINSAEDLFKALCPQAVETIEAGVNMTGAAENIDAAYANDVDQIKNEADQFLATGSIGSFVDVIKMADVVKSQQAMDASADVVKSQQAMDAAADVVKSQQAMDAAADVVKAQSQVNAVTQSSNINYVSGFIVGDVQYVKSFSTLYNTENIGDIIKQAYPDLDAATNIEGFVDMYCHEISQYMSNYVNQSSNIQNSNVDVLKDIIVPQ